MNDNKNTCEVQCSICGHVFTLAYTHTLNDENLADLECLSCGNTNCIKPLQAIDPIDSFPYLTHCPVCKSYNTHYTRLQKTSPLGERILTHNIVCLDCEHMAQVKNSYILDMPDYWLQKQEEFAYEKLLYLWGKV